MTTATKIAARSTSVSEQPSLGAPPTVITQPAAPSSSVSWAGRLVVVYMVLMPFLVGLPRGTGLPLLRPSETLQLAVTGLAVLLAVPAIFRGGSWHLRLKRSEWWLAAIVITASVLPILWLVVRSEPVGRDELLASFPFIKYGALYFLARACIRTTTDARNVLYAVMGTASVVAAIAVTQSLGVGPVVDVLGRYFVSGEADLVDEGRGTATIGSSIATGAYLSISCGMALSLAFVSGRARWFGFAAVLAVGALASGQAGTVLALGTVLFTVGFLHRRLRQLAAVGIPFGLLGLIGLWPIVAARLADLDQGSGLPQSWIVRWVNLSELYWPSLANGGWILGVNPDASVTPPDVWREIVYLESGYLWLLWVGGVPLLASVLLFLRAAYRELGVTVGAKSLTEDSLGLRRAAQAAIAMFGLVSVFDPHITLRAGADLFFVLVAIASASVPFIVPQPAPHRRWHSLLGPTLTPGTRPFAQLTVAELDLGSEWANAESAVAIGVEDADGLLARAELALYRSPTGLHGVLLKPLDAIDDEATALLWRGLALCASSLRLRSLHPVDGAAFQGRQLKWAGRLSEKLEIERATNSHVAGSHVAASTETNPASGAIRLTPGTRVPSWKRASDLLIGATAALVTAPLWLIVALVVRRSSPGPVLFRQVRIGAGGLPFQMYKFRTMYLDNDDSAHREQNRLELLGEAPAVKDACDVRITGIGRWLRRLSLDELPQLLNVARADMSLVGPRPSLMWEVELFEQSKRRRMEARPGLTGLWQVSGRGDISMSEMLDLDLDYVADIRPMVDARCLAATARSVLDGRGAR